MTEQQEQEFIKEASERGSFIFIKRYHDRRVNRFMVTVNNVSIPCDITDEVWNNLGLHYRERNL